LKFYFICDTWNVAQGLFNLLHVAFKVDFIISITTQTEADTWMPTPMPQVIQSVQVSWSYQGGRVGPKNLGYVAVVAAVVVVADPVDADPVVAAVFPAAVVPETVVPAVVVPAAI
jgi:hypothetical protein